MVVFRPFVGEYLTGQVQSCSESGIRVNMGFFDDVYIEPKMIFEGARLYADGGSIC